MKITPSQLKQTNWREYKERVNERKKNNRYESHFCNDSARSVQQHEHEARHRGTYETRPPCAAPSLPANSMFIERIIQMDGMDNIIWHFDFYHQYFFFVHTFRCSIGRQVEEFTMYIYGGIRPWNSKHNRSKRLPRTQKEEKQHCFPYKLWWIKW